jgi:uncharacterized membrane protein
MKLVRCATLSGIIVTVLLTIAVYPSLPPVFASHWNASGMADGSMTKLSGLIFIPLIMIACVALFVVLPRIEPLRKNYVKFRDYYEGFILAFVLYLLAIQILMVLWNLGYPLSTNVTFPILFGILFVYIGFLLEHAEQNWFVGIRTPWTLTSIAVWKKTNERGGKLFKLAGITSFLGALAGSYALWFMLVPVLIVAVYTVVYSYVAYQDELKGL